MFGVRFWIFIIVPLLISFYQNLGHLKLYNYKVSGIKSLSSHAGYLFSSRSFSSKAKELNRDVFLDPSSSTHFPTSFGGLNGVIQTYFLSLFEVFALYECPLGGTGSSGRHLMNISVTVMQGEISLLDELNVQPIKKLTAGDSFIIRSLYKYNVQIAPKTYLLIYARGFTLYSLPYAVSDLVTSQFDPVLTIQTTVAYVKNILFGNFTFDYNRVSSKLDIVYRFLAKFYNNFLKVLLSVYENIQVFFSRFWTNYKRKINKYF